MDDERVKETLVRHIVKWENQERWNGGVDKELSKQDSRLTALEKKLIIVAMLASGGGAALSQILLKIV